VLQSSLSNKEAEGHFRTVIARCYIFMAFSWVCPQNGLWWPPLSASTDQRRPANSCFAKLKKQLEEKPVANHFQHQHPPNLGGWTQEKMGINESRIVKHQCTKGGVGVCVTPVTWLWMLEGFVLFCKNHSRGVG